MKRALSFILFCLFSVLFCIESEPKESDDVVYFHKNVNGNMSYHFLYQPFQNETAENLSTMYDFLTLTSWDNERQGWKSGFIQGLSFTDFEIEKNDILLGSLQQNKGILFAGNYETKSYQFSAQNFPSYHFFYFPLERESVTGEQLFSELGNNVLSISYWNEENQSWIIDQKDESNDNIQIYPGNVYRILINGPVSFN